MIDSSAIERLRPIGLTPALIQQLASTAADKEDTATAIVLLRVTEVQREGLTLHDGVQRTRGPPAARAARRAWRDGDAIAVGDWVLADAQRATASGGCTRACRRSTSWRAGCTTAATR